MCGNVEWLQSIFFFGVVLFGFVNGELPMKWLKFHPLQHNLYKHRPSEDQGSFSFNLKYFQSSFSVFIIFFTLWSALLGSAPLRWSKMLGASLANDRGRWGVVSYSRSTASLVSLLFVRAQVNCRLAIFVKMPLTLWNGIHFFRVM